MSTFQTKRLASAREALNASTILTELLFADGNGIKDDAGNEQLTFGKVASAVNYFKMTNAATGGAPKLEVAGDDTNIDMLLSAKGTGAIRSISDLYIQKTGASVNYNLRRLDNPGAWGYFGFVNGLALNSAAAEKAYVGMDFIVMDPTAGAEYGAWALEFLRNGALVEFLSAYSNIFQISDDNAGSSHGPILKLHRNSASPAGSDNLGQIQFFGKDSGGNDTQYANIYSQISDPTDGSEDGSINFEVRDNGNLGWTFQIAYGYMNLYRYDSGAAAGPEINLTRDGGSPAASDDIGIIQFKGKDSALNSETYAQIYAKIFDPTNGAEEASLRFALLKTAVGASPTYSYEFYHGSLIHYHFDSGAGYGPEIRLVRDGASPAASDILGALRFLGEDSASNSDEYARIQAEIVDATSTSEDGLLAFKTVIAGTLATRGYFGNGVVWGSPTSGDLGAGLINSQGFYENAMKLFPVLHSTNEAGDKTLNNDANLQTWLAAANDTLTVEAGVSYIVEGEIYITNGATTHTISLDWDGGTCSFTSFFMNIISQSAAAGTTGQVQDSIQVASAAETVINATSTALGCWIRFRGKMKINAGGTFIPNMKFSANPTGTCLAKAGSWIRLTKLGSSFVSNGAWA